MKLLILDNYDSFTWNLHHYVAPLVDAVDVVRNDQIDLLTVGQYDGIILSPGPGLPSEAGLMPELLAQYKDTIPMLGVCLGHQAISELFGGRLINLEKVYHGRVSECRVLITDFIFEDEPITFEIGHYHSWIIDPEMPGEDIEVTAVNEFGWIMAIRHRYLPLRGIQFHPESVMTPNGFRLIRNWINGISADRRKPTPSE